jgi:lycopene elongase/hydratase (dihydrobisanhydrobacterioruberin-forming)
MDRAIFLIRVSRPILWPVLPIVYFLGLHSAGASVTATAVVQMILLAFPMNLFGCGLNDIYDIESDQRSGRRRAFWGADVTQTDAVLIWRACLATGAAIVVGALVTRNPWNIGAAILMILVAMWYSVPPVRLKERPPLDSLSNGVGYFLMPFVMGYSLGADPRAMPLKYWLLAFGVCGIHALATAADYEADRAAGHRTFAVVFGRRAAAAFAAGTFLVALISGDFHSAPVRVYLAIGMIVAVSAVALPRDRVIATACTVIFAGFLLAAICHVAGL